MRVNTNVSAVVANNQLSKAQLSLERSLERLSSGYKINHASDDAAGMAISQKMRSQIRGLERATTNAADGVSVVQTAEGAITEIQSMMERLKELSVQAANDVNSDEEREALQMEIDSLKKEVNRIANDTEFNTQPLINGNLERRVYSDVRGVKQLECSENINAGQYGITVTQDARQAIAVGTPVSDASFVGGQVPASMKGNITINGYIIDINEGDDMNDVVTKLTEGMNKVGGSLLVVDDTTDTTGSEAETAGYTPEPSVTSGTSSLVFMTTGYGAEEKLNITCSNSALAAALGIDAAATAAGFQAEGLDVQAEFTIEGGERVGFSDTAKISTNGTRITVKDLNNKSFVMDVPGNIAGTVFDDSAVIAAGTTAAPKSIEQEVTDIGMMRVQVGANEHQMLELNIPKISTYTIGIEDVNVMTGENAGKAIDSVDKAIIRLSQIRSGLGAFENRLDHTTSNLEVSSENLTAALSRIVDTDMAEEMTTYTQQSVLSQAGTSMLAQANARPESVLQLLQN